MSALPKKVREQAKRAQDLHDAAYNPEKSKNAGKKPDEQNPTANIEGSEVSPKPPFEIVSVEEFKPGENADVIDTITEGFEVDGNIGATVDTIGDPWEHKYNVINGKYKAEVPRLHKEIKQLRDQVGNMQSLISRLEQVPAPTAPIVPIENTPATPVKLLNDSEVEAYGADLIDVVKRAAREEMAPEVSRLENENLELRRKLDGVSETVVSNARQSVYDVLDIEMGAMEIDWREMNADAGFLNWLGTMDAYTNTVRRDQLTEAFEANDAARVVAFFKGYLKENAVVSTTANETPTPKKAAVDMASLAAPGKPKGGTAPGTQEGRQTWRQVEIAAFYADVRKGKFKGNADEKLRLEQSIMDAVKYNRVVA